ncbi:FAD-dependent monooxygenase [Microbaculum marinum]|uniref:FAD-dependent monooxygenase n=1 Tax=Microbaculum marinum TaxID=1764581 RepID=A0AAW9S342_9HYPH
MAGAERSRLDPVLIVGAGPTGLVLAIELARRNVPFHLIDRLAGPVGWSQAIFIKPRTLEILSGLGLAPRLYEHGQIVDGVDLYSDGRKVAGYRFAELDTPFPHILSLPESDVIRILTDRLEELGGSVDYGVEFVGLSQAADGASAHLRSGGRDHELEASWIVGTDGYHSAVREAVGGDFDGTDHPGLWAVFDTHLAGWNKPRNIVCAQLDAPIVIPFPLGEDRWRIYFNTGATGGRMTGPQALQVAGERLRAICPDARLTDPQDPGFFRCHSRLARDFRIGRILLAGDAAHASNPIEGHGMNAGIQDAYNLGWKLAAIMAGKAREDLLGSYQAERRSTDREIVASGEEAYARMAVEGRELRQELYDFLSTGEGRSFAALAESELGFAYRDSPIVEAAGDAPAGSPRATEPGCRVGDVPGLVRRGAPVALHDLLAPSGMTVFLFPAEASAGDLARQLDALREAAARDDDLALYAVRRASPGQNDMGEDVVFDTGGSLHERLSADVPTLCVVRPDGHLGLCIRPPSPQALTAHLALMYG